MRSNICICGLRRLQPTARLNLIIMKSVWSHRQKDYNKDTSRQHIQKPMKFAH